jgi:tetratricopeptide (TPR) repeat protein
MAKTRNARPQVESPAATALQASFNQGLALHQQGKLADAERIYREVLRQQPNHFDALHLLGVIAVQTQQTELGVALLTKAIGLNAKIAAAHSNLGIALLRLKRPQEALASHDKAIALDPDFADAYYNRGIALRDLKRPEDALASYDKAIALKPHNAEAHYNRGNALRDLRRAEEALASHDKAIALKPDYAEAHYNRGIALMDLQRCEEALASYDKAIALKPDYTDACWNQSLCFLLTGRFEQGWRQHEWRKKLKKPLGLRSYPQPLWLGEDNIAGKTLFIYWEQGFGDTIQFCRYAKCAEELGAKVIFSVQQPLLELLKQLSPTIRIVGPLEEPADFDYHCPLLSLPLAFKTTVSNIPATVPYLKGNIEQSLFWKERLGEKSKPRVGLVWSGGFRPYQTESWTINNRRNIPLSKLAVLKNPDIEFYSLQKGEPAESELADLVHRYWDGPQIIDLTSQLRDFSDTAALVENLDLVISVDTATAHLAAAMAKPVWLLNRFDTCWRWFLERSDSPWYPTVKLYRQEKAGQWDDVVERIRSDLNGFRLAVSAATPSMGEPPLAPDDPRAGRAGSNGSRVAAVKAAEPSLPTSRLIPFDHNIVE